MIKNIKKKSTSQKEYDQKWIEYTWGWDTPEYFIKTKGENLRPRVYESIRLAELKTGMKVLDIGCGRGEVVMHCARNGIQAVGVDYSTAAINIAKLAKNRHTKKEQALMTFINTDISSIKETNSYDRIFLLDFVEHLYDWELSEVFSKCMELLKPSGAIIIHTLPNKWVYDVTYAKLLRLLIPFLPKNPRSDKEKKIHVNEMSIAHLYNILQKSGFRSTIWLSDLIVEQAKWHLKQPFQNLKGKLYFWLNKPFIGTLYRMIALTPLRLLTTNDIFAVAWKNSSKACVNTIPNAITEKLAITIINRLYINNN